MAAAAGDQPASAARLNSMGVTHTILNVDQVLAILSHLREPCYTMAFLDAATGLRISELLALQWKDIDFAAMEVRVSRAIVYGVVGRCKSKVSKKPVPDRKSVV